MTGRSRRWIGAIASALLIVAIVAGVPAIRLPVLQTAGWALVAQDQLAPADVIVISLDSGGAGVLEASDLVGAGIANRVAVFADPPSAEEQEFVRRGAVYADATSHRIEQLAQLGIADVERIVRPDASTQGESEALLRWCNQNRFRSIVVVSSRDHARRMRRVLARVMKDHTTKVSVRGSRYSAFDPDDWWKTRSGIRTEIIEIQKLALDIVMHPLQW
jgi:hypothetical protein